MSGRVTGVSRTCPALSPCRYLCSGCPAWLPRGRVRAGGRDKATRGVGGFAFSSRKTIRDKRNTSNDKDLARDMCGTGAGRMRDVHARALSGVCFLSSWKKGVVMGQRWDWLPRAMPTVAALIAERRKLHGAAWVAQCWERGVVGAEPGWFYAVEGALAVGVPINAEVVLAYHQSRLRAPGAVLLDMRLTEVAHAAA